MKIIVKTKLITAKQNDWSKQLMNEVTNETVSAIKVELDKELKEYECEIHKKLSKGTIIIIAGTIKKIDIKYSNFCCEEFRKSLNIKI